MIQLIPQDKQAEFLQVVPMEELMKLQTLAEVCQIAQTWIAPQAQVVASTSTSVASQPTYVPAQAQSQDAEQEEVPLLILNISSHLIGLFLLVVSVLRWFERCF